MCRPPDRILQLTRSPRVGYVRGKRGTASTTALLRDQLLNLSRLHNDEVYDRSIDVQVGRLRKKLEPGASQPRLIRTERGAGYVSTASVEIVR